MAQTQEEYHYRSVGNRPSYCLDIMELILVHHNSQRLSFRHRIEGESDIWAFNDGGVKGEGHAAGHPFQVDWEVNSQSKFSAFAVCDVWNGFVGGAVELQVGAEVHFADVEEGRLNGEGEESLV